MIEGIIIFIATYTLNKKSIAIEEMCYIQQCIRRQLLYSLFLKKHSFYICHTYWKVLYEMHSGKFIQQLMKVKGFEYPEHSN